MPLQWANCPVCGVGHSTLDPTAPCSSQCRGRMRQADAMGKTVPTAEPKYRRADERRGKSTAPGPVPKKKGGLCSIALLPPALGAAALLTAAARRWRR